jgi:hypothetical protein
MRIKTYNLDGRPGPEAELWQDDQAQLWLDDQVVLAVNLWGAKVALTLIEQLVLIALWDYWTFISNNRREAHEGGFTS